MAKKEFEIPNSHKLLFNELDQAILSINNKKVLYVPFDQVYELKTDEIFIGSSSLSRRRSSFFMC